jgi:hypothetical protein
MSRITLVGSLALLALLVASPLLAQQRGRGFGGGGFGGGFGITKAQLLANENVQKELDLVDIQKEEIDQIVEESRAGRRGGRGGFQDLSPEEIQKMVEERQARNREIDKKIDAVLVGPQRSRLNEIYIQALGTGAFSVPEIAKELGISEELQTKMNDTRMEAFQAAFQGGGFGGGGGGTARGGFEQFAKIREESDKKVVALLSDDQKAKFEKMKGKKVNFDLTTIGFGGRGGRRGGGGGNQ